MPETTIYVRGTRQDIRRRIALLPAIIAGRVPDEHGIAHGFAMRLAYTFLSKVKQAFVVKARGGTDEGGIKWDPLTREYLAYGRRFARGEQAALKQAAGLGPANRFAPGGNKGLLTAAQLRRWRQVYAQMFAWLAAREPVAMAKAIAAGHAWNVLKKEGARTKLEVFGSRQVEIGRDTGIMFNSLSPGELSIAGPDAAYATPDSQIVEAQPGEVLVGTNVAYARHFHKRRPLWPGVLPKTWLDAIAQAAAESLGKAVHLIVGGRAA